jgi:hypothetical protein
MAPITAAMLYAAARDFQPLIAALVFLAAALVALRSGRAAARRQAETALAVQQRQFRERLAEDERARHRRELATTIRLAVRFQLMKNLLADRLDWIKAVEERCLLLPGAANAYLVNDGLDIWRWLKQAGSIAREAEAYESRPEDIEYLDPRYQLLHHSLYRLVFAYDRLHAEAVAGAEASSPTAVYLEPAKDAASEAIAFLSKNQPRLATRIKHLGSKPEPSSELTL